MASHAFRKALGHTVAGVAWRLVVFLAVALCFYALIQLREWYTSYAPSQEWASATGKKEAWSPEVRAAAMAMSKAQTVETYPSKDKFYKALLDYIREGDELTSMPDVQNYRRLRERREEIDNSFRQGIEPRDDDFLQKSSLLSENTRAIAAVEATIKHLKKIEKRDAIQEKVLEEAEEEGQQIRAQTLGLLTEVQVLVTGRGTIETGFQKRIADLTARIKEEEEGIREAFDAVPLPARPVHRLPWFRESALKIGDETNPLHVLYLIAWYGLEAVMVLLLCGVLVPWLLRFGGDTSDPKAVQSKVTQWIKELFVKAFGERAVAALAMAVVGSAAAAGVAIAAGDQPSILPPIHHDGTAVAGEKGDRGDSGDTGKDGNAGKDGGAGEDEKCGQCTEAGLTDLRGQLERQAFLIEELQGKLYEVEGKAKKNSEEVLELNGKVKVAKGNMDRLSSAMETTHQGMDSLSGSIGGLYSANQSILELSNATRQQMVGSLYRLEHGASATTAEIQSVRKTVDQAAMNVPPVASDVLWMNAVPDSAWARVSPFHRYRMTPEVMAAVERAMKGVDPGQRNTIIAALHQLERKPMGITSFRRELRTKCSSCGHLTLKQWTPLIVKLSRVQE